MKFPFAKNWHTLFYLIAASFVPYNIYIQSIHHDYISIFVNIGIILLFIRGYLFLSRKPDIKEYVTFSLGGNYFILSLLTLYIVFRSFESGYPDDSFFLIPPFVLFTFSYMRLRKLAIERNEHIEKLTSAMDNAYDSMIITDDKGVIEYVNGSFEAVTGYSKEEIIGNKPSLWGGLMDKEYYKVLWETISQKKVTFVGALKNRKKDGSFYDAEIRIIPVTDKRSGIVSYIGIERDITKEKKLDALKLEFLSIASHQLRTPLTAIKWVSEMLDDGDSGLNDKQKEYIQKIRSSNEQMIRLVNSLLNVTRIDGGRVKISPVPTDIHSFIESKIAELRSLYEPTHLQIEREYAPNLPAEIIVDRSLLSHAFTNIFSNACKYSHPGSPIRINVTPANDSVQIAISDNGIGIPLQERDLIFTKFYRGSNAGKIAAEGSGLGLYISKRITEMLNGKIWFESKSGQTSDEVGTTFYLSLPVKGVEAQEGEVSLS